MVNPCDIIPPVPCIVNPAFTYTRYPCDQDDPRPGDTRGLPVIVDLQTPVKAEIVNRHREAILAIEGELGINPSGDYSTLRDRLDQIQSSLCTIWNGLDNVGIIVASGILRILSNNTYLADGYGVQELNFKDSGVSAVIDPSFATNGRVNITIPQSNLNQVLTKGNSSGGVNINLGSNSKIINSLDPTSAQDVATKNYVDTKTTLMRQQRFVATAGQTTFVLSNTPASLQATELFIGGLSQTAGVDYTLSGNTVTFIGNFTIANNEEVVVKYFENSTFITVSQGLSSVMRVYNGTDGYSINFGGNSKGINSLDPTNPQDLATKSYVDGKTTVLHQQRFLVTAGQTSFVLSNTPTSLEGTEFFVDGLSQSAGVDYTLSGNTVTYTGSTPFIGDEEIVIKYFENSAFITVSQGLASVLGVSGVTGGLNINFGGNSKGINSLDPTNPQDLATKNYVDNKATLLHQERFVATAGQTTFVLSNKPSSLQSTELFIDGLSQSSGVDFTLLNKTVTYIGSYTFTGGEEVSIKYFESSAFITVSQGLSSVMGVYNGTDGYSINFGGNSKGINSLDPTNPQDLATKSYVDKIVSVDNVATLRSTSSLTAFGFINLECHTTKGWGGGPLYWDSSSTEADNNGTIFQVTGVITGRWKRYVGDAVDPCWFGAVGNYTTGSTPDSTTAFRDALVWMGASPLDRSMKINQGTYLITDELNITTNMTILGSGHGTRIYFNNVAKSCFVIGRSAWAFNVKLKDFSIDGPVGCGFAAIEIGQSILSFDIDLVVRGGFQYGWYSHFTEAVTNNGAAQWGSLKLTTLRQLSGPVPANYIYSDSYFNACEVTFYATGGTGTGLTLIAGSPTGGGTHYSRFRGDIEAFNKGFALTGVSGATFNHFTSEGNTNPDTMINCSYMTLGVGGASNPVQLTNCHNIKLIQWSGGFVTDGYCYHIQRNNCSYGALPITRTNASEITTYGGTAEFRGQVESAGGFGTNEPINILLNGDFIRWNADGYAAGMTYWEGKVTKCGVGQADTTRTAYSPYCAKVQSNPGYVYGWTFYWDIPMTIPQHLLNCDITLSLKAKYVSGSTVSGNIGYTICAQNDLQWTYVGGDMPCENGFRFHTMTARVSQAMIDNGIRMCVAGYQDAVFYISELSLSFGTIASRTFNRCSNRIGIAGELKDNGSLITYTDSIPVSANDPLFNRPWLDDDIALLNNPTFLNGIIQTGWIRQGSVWVPLLSSQNVANVTSLRARADLINLKNCHLLCHTYDGYGGGDLYWDATSTEADNNGTVFQVTGVTTGRWKRPHQDQVNIFWFGAKADATRTVAGTDNTAAMIAAHATGRVVFYPRGLYSFTKFSFVRGGIIGEGRGTQLWCRDTSTDNIITYTGNDETDTIEIDNVIGPIFRDFCLFTPAIGSKSNGAGIRLDPGIAARPTDCPMVRNAHFHNVMIRYLPIGISISNGTAFVIDNCRLHYNSIYGIYEDQPIPTHEDDGDNTISNNSIVGTTNTINVNYRGGGLRMWGNKVLLGEVGVQFSPLRSTSIIKCFGNSIEGQSSNCLRFISEAGTAATIFTQVQISDNIITSIGSGTPINIAPTHFPLKDLQINNNEIRTNRTDPANALTIGNTDRFTIMGNLFNGASGAYRAVAINADAANGKISSNLYTAFTYSILNVSSTTVEDTFVQTGNETTTTDTVHGTMYRGSETITFPVPFRSAPKILVCFNGFANGEIACMASSVTATNFVLTVISTANGAAPSTNWRAEGLPV